MNFKDFMKNDKKLNELIDAAINNPDLDKSIKSRINQFDYDGGEIPTVTRKGTIVTLELKKNPIRVILSDGTQCYFTYDQFKRINGTPQVGKVMTVVFQRNPKNNDITNSPIKKIIITD